MRVAGRVLRVVGGLYLDMFISDVELEQTVIQVENWRLIIMMAVLSVRQGLRSGIEEDL